MLVLTRKPTQCVTIDNRITVRVIRVRGNTVQLGIEAPRDIPIMRSELLAKPEQSAAGDEQSEQPAGETDPEDVAFASPATCGLILDCPLQQFLFAP